jgi:hypothetical protein
MRSARPRFTLALLFAIGLTACASSSVTKPPSQGPLYSTVPCPDACGNDAQCQAKCVPAGNNPPNMPPNMPFMVGH